MQKQTKQREAVLRALLGSDAHPTADWIYGEVRKELPNISLGTVYRNLHLLADSGAIREVNFDGETSRFEGRTDEHYHFRCQSCGRVYDLDSALGRDLNRLAAEQTGFLVTGHRLDFTGSCARCQPDSRAPER